MKILKSFYNQPGSAAFNILANLSGRFWSSLLSLWSVPIFISMLGAESFGLIGFFSTFDVLFNFLDFGLSTTINREIARNMAQGGDPGKNKSILRTFETIYWSIGIFILLCMLASSGWIAANWVKIDNLSISDVRTALMVISVAFWARWPVSLYTGVLRGLQTQVIQNVILVVSATVKVAGGILALNLLAPTIRVYVTWYAFACVFEITLVSLAAWGQLNRISLSSIALFDWSVIQRTWKFALSFNLTGVIGVLIASADRIVISKVLPLSQLGYYSVASTAAGAMPMVSTALMTAFFPKFVSASVEKDNRLLNKSFWFTFELCCFISIGLALFVVFYSRELLQIWTASNEVVLNANLPVVFLALANMVNAITSVPYTLLVAQGHTKVTLFFNVAAAIIFIPAQILIIPVYGLPGAAIIFLLFNSAMLLYYLFFTNRLIMRGNFLKPVAMITSSYALIGLFCMGLPGLLSTGITQIIIQILFGLLYILFGVAVLKSGRMYPRA